MVHVLWEAYTYNPTFMVHLLWVIPSYNQQSGFMGVHAYIESFVVDVLWWVYAHNPALVLHVFLEAQAYSTELMMNVMWEAHAVTTLTVHVHEDVHINSTHLVHIL